MQKKYLVTIFSKDKGKTRTFSLNRRVIYLPLVAVILLAVSCVFFGKAYFHERAERQRLEGRIALLEQLMSGLEDSRDRHGGEAPKEVEAEPEVEQPTVSVALKREEKEAAIASRELGVQTNNGDTENKSQSGEPEAKIGDAKATSLEEDREGFRLDFKLVNLIGEPISGNVAIIASLKPPHQPRFVSFPSMQLLDGMPVRLRKSVGFNIRYFKYVTGRFYFPFSHSESFRILVYNRDEEVILDSTLSAEDIAVYGLLSNDNASSTISSHITSKIN